MTLSQLKKKKILIEASKLSKDKDSNDGCKRYLIEVLKGLKRIESQWKDKWDIDLYLEGRVFSLDEVVNNLSSPPPARSLSGGSLSKSGVISSLKNKAAHLLEKSLPHTSYNKLVHLKHRQYYLRKRAENEVKDYLRQTYFKFKKMDLRHGNYDLIHLPIPVHFVFPYGSNTKFVTTVHDFTHKKFPEFHVESNIYYTQRGIDFAVNKNTSWIAISESTKTDLLHYCKVDASKVRTILEAADNQLFKPYQDEEDLQKVLKKYNIPNKPFFLSLSTLEPRKNISNVIKAFNLLLEENQDLDVYMVISGKIGWKMEGLMHGIIERNAARIIFTGFVDDNDLPKLYSKARALTYVSYYEGFGLPPLEAMSCGTPVIYGNNSSQIEIVGDAGLPADPDSITEIKEQMVKLYKDEQLFQDMKRRALERAALFSWDKCAEETISYYESILSS